MLSQAVLGLWEVVNNLTRLRPTRRRRYRVTIFGSARTDPDHWVYAAVRDLAAELTRLGCDIVTGGGPGLMQAANEGATHGRGGPRPGSVGIRVDLPFEQDVNPFVGQAFEHRTFFSRLHHFVLVSDAFVVVPGGIGTVLETMMIWQLLQVRKLHDTPLILAGAHVGRAGRLGQEVDAPPRWPAGQPRGLRHPDLLPDRARDPRRHPRAPRPLESEPGGHDRDPTHRLIPRARRPSAPRATASATSSPDTGAGPSRSPARTTPCTSGGWSSTTSSTRRTPGPASSSRPSPPRSATCSPSAGSRPSSTTTGPTPSRSTTCRWSS